MRWSTPGSREQPDPAGAFPLGALPVEIVGEAENGPEALEQVRMLAPDVVVMDLHAQPESGVEQRVDGLATIEAINRGWPSIRIVVLTLFATDRVAVLSAGADAYLLKGCPTHELLDSDHAPRAVCARPGLKRAPAATRKEDYAVNTNDIKEITRVLTEFAATKFSAQVLEVKGPVQEEQAISGAS